MAARGALGRGRFGLRGDGGPAGVGEAGEGVLAALAVDRKFDEVTGLELDGGVDQDEDAAALEHEREDLVARDGGEGVGSGGGGRVGAGAPHRYDAVAVPAGEPVLELKGAAELPIDYRAGIAHQALGSAEAARAAFKRFVAAGKGSKGNLEDAKKRLEQLGG